MTIKREQDGIVSSDKLDLKICKRQSTLYINNGSIWQEDTAIINVYAMNNRPSKYIKQRWTSLKEERVVQ